MAEHLSLPKTATGFGRRLTNLKRVIELEMGVKLREERDRRRTRWVELTPTADDADDADVRARNFSGSSR
jgi:hypothetical protein